MPERRRAAFLDRLAEMMLKAPRLLLFAAFTGAAVLVGEGLTVVVSLVVIGRVGWTALAIGFGAGFATSAAAAALFASLLGRLGQLQEELSQSARTDELTGLPNRRALFETLAREIGRARRRDARLSVAFADLDRFKPVNDQHGHRVGDVVLREVGSSLRGCLRAYDLVARYGGDEFVLVLPETGAFEAHAVAERIREVVARRSFASSVTLTLSFGVAGYAEGMNVDALMQAADAALYRAKQAGRNRSELALEGP